MVKRTNFKDKNRRFLRKEGRDSSSRIADPAGCVQEAMRKGAVANRRGKVRGGGARMEIKTPLLGKRGEEGLVKRGWRHDPPVEYVECDECREREKARVSRTNCSLMKKREKRRGRLGFERKERSSERSPSMPPAGRVDLHRVKPYIWMCAVEREGGDLRLPRLRG